MKKIDSIREIIELYDTFLLDQWGVLHNGGEAFKDAIWALELLKNNNKNVVIISNSGKLGFDSYEILSKSGIARNLYNDVITSGDQLHYGFVNNFFNLKGNKTYYLSWGNTEDKLMLEVNNLDQVTSLKYADFILCAGVEFQDFKCYLPILKEALKIKLPMIVSNPDKYALNPLGEKYMCPGLIADKYEKMGGKVFWHGKPQKKIYDICKEKAGGWKNAIAVGDSLSHDIKGAKNNDLSSIFITSGVHKTEIEEMGVEKVVEKSSIFPDYYLNYFK